MPRVRDLLYRFRPAGTPGAAGLAGVPADRVAESEAELEPLFAQLASTEQACAHLLDEARQEAEEIRLRGQAQVQALLSSATSRAETERASTAARLGRQGEMQSSSAREAAEAGVETLRRRADETMPSVVASVIAQVAGLIGVPATSVPERVDLR